MMTTAERDLIKQATDMLAKALDRIEEVHDSNEDFYIETYEAHKQAMEAWSKFNNYTKE